MPTFSTKHPLLWRQEFEVGTQILLLLLALSETVGYSATVRQRAELFRQEVVTNKSATHLLQHQAYPCKFTILIASQSGSERCGRQAS